MNVPFLNLPLQHEAIRQALLDKAAEAFASARFIGGPEVAGFETEFAAWLGAEAVAGVGSGTEALHLALRALGVGKGDLVAVPPNTFIATAEAVMLAGAEVVFVDVDPVHRLMDPEALGQTVAALNSQGKRLAAVIPVHLYGAVADMEAIGAIAEAAGALVIEDAAQAHGAKRFGKSAGTFGRAAAFSFYPGKNLGACGEAGAVSTNDPDLARRVRMLADHGQREKYHHECEGVNGRLDALQAAFLRVKLPLLEGWNESRRTIADRFDAALADCPAAPVPVPPGCVSSRHLYVVHAPDRDALGAHLTERGVGWGLHYPVPLHLSPAYARLGHKPGDFPNAEASAASLLSLPIWPEMPDDMVEWVIESVLGFYAGSGR